MNPLFLAHTSAVAALCLAFGDHGASSGCRLLTWRRDEDSWEDWTSTSLRGESVGKMRPDAHAQLQLDGGDVVSVFFEIDRGTMDHRRLIGKVRRYCAYANAEAWQPRHQILPALALVTTSEKRAQRFLEGAGRLASSSISPRIAASWSVDNMAVAVSDSVWATSHDATPRTLRCTLAEITKLQIRQKHAAMESQARQAGDELLSAWRSLRQLVRASKQEGQIEPYIAVVVDVIDSLDPYGDRSFEWARAHSDLVEATLRSFNGVELPRHNVQDWQGFRNNIWRQQSAALVAHWREMQADHAQLRVTTMRLLMRRCASFRSFQRALSHRDDAEDAASLALYRERRSRDLKTSSPFSRRQDASLGAISAYDKRFLVMCEGCGVRRHIDGGPICLLCNSRLVPSQDTSAMMTELARMIEGSN